MDPNLDKEEQKDNEFSNEPPSEGSVTQPDTEIKTDNEPDNEPLNNEQTDFNPEPQAVQPIEQQAPGSPQPQTETQSHFYPAPETNKFKALLKKPLFYVILAVTIGLIIGAILLLGGGSDEDTANNTDSEIVTQERVTTLGASIALVEGTVEISINGVNWKEASGGESLAQSDYVRTSDASRAIILLDDGSVARLDSNSEVWLSSLETTGFEITLQKGQVYSRVINSDELSYTVVTANERYESLGTAYKTSTTGSDDVLEVYHSDVKVGSQDIDVSEGNKYDTATKVVTAIDLAQLDLDEFAQWNKQKDSESAEFKDKLGVLKDREQEPAPPPPVSNPSVPSGVTLSASEQSDGVKLSWTLQGLSSQQGFKVIRSATDNTPTFGENDAQYVGDPAERSRVWASEKGGSHFYRVCIFFEGTCSNYSNTVKANSPAKVVTPVVSGGVTLAISGKTLSWTLSGGNAPHGYKVLLSTSQQPTYPANSIQYTGAQSVELPGKEAGTYYVRVCKFTNGSQAEGCVDYSNQVEYIVAGS